MDSFFSRSKLLLRRAYGIWDFLEKFCDFFGFYMIFWDLMGYFGCLCDFLGFFWIYRDI